MAIGSGANMPFILKLLGNALFLAYESPHNLALATKEINRKGKYQQAAQKPIARNSSYG